MSGWVEANKVANVAAARALGALQVDLTAPRVDIEAAIANANLELLWRPMPRLFGLYFNEPDANIGILVNSGLPRGARRHTAAHELGHHTLAHATSLDDGSTINIGYTILDALPDRGVRRPWTHAEMAAEAFAVWFLMPRRVVASALRLLGRERPESAIDVYRLSVILGASYATTLRHLPNLRLASVRDTNTWSRVPPGRLKARLDRGVQPPADRRRDVLVVDDALSEVPLQVECGDRVVLPGVEATDVRAPTWLEIVGTTVDAELGDGVVLDVLDLSESHTGQLSTTTSASGWTVTAGPQQDGRHPNRQEHP